VGSCFERSCTKQRRRRCAKIERVLWDAGSNGGGLREGEGEACRRNSIAKLGFYWDFQVFLCLFKRGFLEEEGEKNEKHERSYLIRAQRVDL
jgi:hypothetical protein